MAKTLGGAIIWAQDKRYKLYSSGKLYDVQRDRAESRPIASTEASAEARKAREKLQAAINSMPKPRG